MSRPQGNRTLLAYFSRAGENFHYGDRRSLTVGFTEELAGVIAERIDCDVYRIVPAEPYPDDYDATVERHVHEQETDARPAIRDPLPDLNGYDTVLLGCGVWNHRAPMIVSTFVESLDLSGKTILPFTTHVMSGLGTVESDYAAAAPGATIGPGLAVRGEEASDSATAVEAWLRKAGLLD